MDTCEHARRGAGGLPARGADLERSAGDWRVDLARVTENRITPLFPLAICKVIWHIHLIGTRNGPALRSKETRQ